MEEIWKDVVGFENYFKVSSLGKVLSKRTNKILKTHVNKSGYEMLSTKIGGRQGKCYCLRVHRLVADAFLKNPEEFPEVNHKDGIKINNVPENLEWCDRSINITHAYENRLRVNKRGFEHGQSTLSKEDVEYIEDNPNLSNRKLAKIIGVSHNTIWKVRNKITYTQLA